MMKSMMMKIYSHAMIVAIIQFENLTPVVLGVVPNLSMMMIGMTHPRHLLVAPVAHPTEAQVVVAHPIEAPVEVQAALQEVHLVALVDPLRDLQEGPVVVVLQVVVQVTLPARAPVVVLPVRVQVEVPQVEVQVVVLQARVPVVAPPAEDPLVVQVAHPSERVLLAD